MERPSLPGLPLEDNGRARAEPPGPDRAWRDGPRRRRLLRLALVPLLLGCGAVLGMYFQPPGLRLFFGGTGLEPGAGAAQPMAVPPPRAPGPSDTATGDVVALGRLMPQGDLVQVAPPFGAGDARFARILASEGQALAAGDVIAELDSLPSLRAAVAAAQANVSAQEAALARARANATSSLRESRAELARAQAAATLAQAQEERQRSLLERQLIARATYDEAQTNAVRATRELERASAAMQRQQGGDLQPDVFLAARQVEVARQSLAQAEAELARGLVVAPGNGTVITLHARVGEKASGGNIASFGNLSAMQAELEVYQTDIARVRVGQAVTIASPALAQPLRGTVVRVGREVERQSVLAADPAANTDARVLRVLVAIDPADLERAARMSGLEVTGRIRTQP